MRYKLFILLSLLLFLTACNEKIDSEYLIGGNWVATAGYEDGEIKGIPDCPLFEEGLEFKNEEKVHIATFDEDFYYFLSGKRNMGKTTKVTFWPEGAGVFIYNIHFISDYEMRFEGTGFFEGNSCYLERQ